MAYSSTARAYREAEILAASPRRLVVITYDGMLAQLFRVRAGIVANDLDAMLAALARARAFVGELLTALDHERGGDCAARLASIYVYVLTELQTLGRTRDVKRLDTITGLMRELREAFAEIATTGQPAGA